MVSAIILLIFIFLIFITISYIFYIHEQNYQINTTNYNLKNFTLLNKYSLLSSLLIILLLSLNSLAVNIMTLIFIFYFNSRINSLKITQDNIIIKLNYPMSWYSFYWVKLSITEISQISFRDLIVKFFKTLFSSILLIIKVNFNDILVAFYIKEPDHTEGLDTFEKLFQFQKYIFKYKKPVLSSHKFTGSDEEANILYKKILFQKDATKSINTVRRIPWTFYYNVLNNIEYQVIKQNLLIFYNFFKTTVIALFLSCLYFLYTIFFFKIQFLKQLSAWFIIGMLFFWLISGFNFFFKRYKYGKFTSAIQRFWKRTNACFWLIEGFLILIFFYYFLNSSQEPLYMYDYSGLNQEYLISLHTIGFNVILLSLIIYFMYFTLLRLNSNSWSQLSFFLVIISVFIFYSFFMETYQFYYVLSTFNERLWAFNEEENLWSIEVENPILRTKQQYFLICLIAKYWHFLFIFLSWVFFLMKSYERKSINYVNFGVNLQNIIILYILNLMCYFQWIKWVHKRFLELPYTWFFTNIDNKLSFRFFFEAKLFVLNMFNTNNFYPMNLKTTYKSLYLWNVDSLSIWKFI